MRRGRTSSQVISLVANIHAGARAICGCACITSLCVVVVFKNQWRISLICWSPSSSVSSMGLKFHAVWARYCFGICLAHWYDRLSPFTINILLHLSGRVLHAEDGLVKFADRVYLFLLTWFMSFPKRYGTNVFHAMPCHPSSFLVRTVVRDVFNWASVS